MKTLKTLTVIALSASFLAAPLAGFAEDAAKPKPYPLKVCIVTGEKIGEGDMKPFTFTYEGQEVKLCCQGCKKKFDADPAKYMAKIKAAEDKK